MTQIQKLEDRTHINIYTDQSTLKLNSLYIYADTPIKDIDIFMPL
jgi:hypothetical protein